NGAVFALVAILAPIFEIVESGSGLRVVTQFIGALEGVTLAGTEPVILTGAGRLNFSFAHDYRGGTPVRIRRNHVLARSSHGESDIWRVNFERIARNLVAQVDLDSSLRQLNLCRAIVKGEDRNAGLARKANRRAANVEFGARVLVGPKVVAGCKRAIGIGGHPILVP